MIQPSISLLHEPDEVLAVTGQFNAQAQTILHEARQIAKTLYSNTTIDLGLPGVRDAYDKGASTRLEREDCEPLIKCRLSLEVSTSRA